MTYVTLSPLICTTDIHSPLLPDNQQRGEEMVCKTAPLFVLCGGKQNNLGKREEEEEI